MGILEDINIFKKKTYDTPEARGRRAYEVASMLAKMLEYDKEKASKQHEIDEILRKLDSPVFKNQRGFLSKKLFYLQKERKSEFYERKRLGNELGGVQLKYVPDDVRQQAFDLYYSGQYKRAA